ncbi:MAG TPA: hypothetical protein VLA88_02360, partial [Candidatus Saccharimonadales bacterium]|nr:hypothetical protein [Candidatus Saccharimonadales bacterium]
YELLKGLVEKQQPVQLTSTTTQTEYVVVMIPATLTERRVHVVHIATAGSMLEEKNYRKLTLVRKHDGTLRVEPDWRV